MKKAKNFIKLRKNSDIVIVAVGSYAYYEFLRRGYVIYTEPAEQPKKIRKKIKVVEPTSDPINEDENVTDAE